MPSSTYFDPSFHLHVHFDHRLNDSNPSLLINWDRVKLWLAKTCSAPNLDPMPTGLRLIDVEQKRVVKAPRAHFDYICLSYVWGGMEEFQLEEGEHGIPSYYEKAGSLEGAPATIEDAMAVCRILDKKYLWVDRLCIPQDGSQKSKKDREAQIGQMGRIYNHAFVTLAAVEGADPRHGLHGVSTRLQLKPAPYKGVYLVARSKWATRAWTLQEAVLSRRLMLFTAHDVVLESENFPDLSSSHLDPSPLFGVGKAMFHGTFEYKDAVQHYTQRELSKQEDAFYAFSGICNRTLGVNHRHALPMTDFDDAMSWVALGEKRERRLGDDGHLLFPTWSWLSIKGPCVISKFYYELATIPLASWAFIDKIDAHGNVSMVYPRPGNHKFLIMNFRGTAYLRFKPRIRLAVKAYVLGCIPGPISPLRLSDVGEESDGASFTYDDFLNRWSNIQDFWIACRGIDADLGTRAHPPYFTEFSEEQRRLAATPKRVLGLSQAVPLTVRPKFSELHDSIADDFLIYHREECVGIGSFDDYKDRQIFMGKEISFFAISVSHEYEWWDSPLARRFADPYRPNDRNFVAFEESDDLLRVIAYITPGNEGVSHRIGFGFIQFGKWLELDRRNCSIVLE